jgi:hypothetical protein
MSKNYKDLNETFNVKGEIVPEEKETPPSLKKVSSNEEEINLTMNDIKKDYEYTRGNLYSLIEKGQNAINGILELAQESEMPRAYEVAGQLIKNVADATDKLMDLQKKLKNIEEETKTKNTTNVTNALFVGSTAELAKILKKQSKNEDL